MPAFIKTPKDEELWEKAKEIVKKQYKKSEKDGEEFWKLVTGVYKRAGGNTGGGDELQKSLTAFRDLIDTWHETK